MTLGYEILLFIVSCIGMLRYKRLTVPFKILAWSEIATFLTAVSSRACIYFFKTNAPALQVLCIEEYVFYAAVYYYLIKGERVKKVIIISIILAVILFPVNAIFLQSFLHRFPTNINTPSQVLFAAFSLLLFKEMLDYPVKMDIIKQSIFWFNTAMLFYATTMFFMLGLSNYLSERDFEDKIITDLWWVIDYSFHILVCIAFLTHSKKSDVVNA